MNIEESIQKLTAALEANTAKLEEILAVASANVADKAVAAPPKKKAKHAVVEAPEPTPEPEAPEPEPEQPEACDPITLNMLKEAVKAAIFDEGRRTTPACSREKFNDLREKFGIDKVAELNEDQIQEFYREVKNW